MQSASHWIAELRAQLPQAVRDDDPEAVHRLRVACGRLSVWLRLGGRSALRADLRWLRRRAAPLRDLDVIAGMPELRRLGAEVEHLRERARHDLAHAVRSPRAAGLLRALPLLDTPTEERARRELRRLSRRAERAARQLARGDAPLDALHALRRRLRALRYAREWLGEPTDALKLEQDELGRCNDRVVLLRRLRELAETDATLWERAAQVEHELEQRADELRRRWKDPEVRARATRAE